MSLGPCVESPFEVLSVDEDADADEVKQAYRDRVKDVHPDQGGSVGEFQLVKAAYEELKDGGAQATEAVDDDSERPAARSPGATAAAEAGDEPEPNRQGRCRVEYLNHEVLDDHGWTLGDGDLFDRAEASGLDPEDYGQFWVRPRESLLEAAERHDFAWPFACRGGACANCAVIVLEGELRTRVDHVLPQEMLDKGFQLSCNGIPMSDELRVVYNVKSMPELEEWLLPPRPFEQAQDD